MTLQQQQYIADIEAKGEILRQTIDGLCPPGSRREEALASLTNALDHARRSVLNEPFNPVVSNLDLFETKEEGE